MATKALTILIHGDWGSGKSWFSQTGPTPRLVIDAEGGAEYTYGRKVTWKDPATEPPAAGDWDTCIVTVRNLKDLQLVAQWLKRGAHPFNSVVLDSLSEMQKRIVDEVGGVDQLDPRGWGEVFRRGEGLVRSFRDLKYNPARPVPCVVYLAGAVERGRKEENVKLRPYVQGQLGSTLPGFVDIVGYLEVDADETGAERHILKVHPSADVVAKDRTHTFRDGVVDVTWTDESGWTNTLESMMQQITEALAEREKGVAS